MDRGTYSSASSGIAQLRKLEIVNNNLANVNTPGYKKQILLGSEQTFDQTLARLVEGQDPYARGDHARTPGVVNLQSSTDFSPGPITHTGNGLDAALRDAHDFFVLDTPEGEQYTRAGNFSINAEGALVSVDGMTVQGDGGGINISGAAASITPDGSVQANGLTAGRLRVVRFEDLSGLERSAGARFKLKEGADAPVQVEPQVEIQSLEMSNVSSISSVVDLITANRAFEMYAKSARSIDDLNQQAISQVGRRRG